MSSGLGGGDDTEAALAEWAKVFHHEDSNAARQIKYRQKKKAEVALLKQTIDELEQTKQRIMASKRTTGILSWKEVAKALIDDRKLSETQHRSLVHDVKRQRGVVFEMSQWVAAQTALQTSLSGTCQTWRHVSLLANPDSRRLGKEWITKQMLHNRDHMFQRHGFPSLASSDVIERDVRFDFQDAGYTSVCRRQVENPWSFEDHIAFFRATLLPVQCAVHQYTPDLPLVVHEVEGNTMQIAVMTRSNEFVNVLVGEFQSEDEYTMVIQQIQEDEMCADDSRQKRQRNRMDWIELRRLPGGGVKTRDLTIVSQLFTLADGHVPLEEDAVEWGISLDGCPDHLKEARFPGMWAAEVDRQLDMHRDNYIRVQMETREEIRAIEAARLKKSLQK